MLKTEQYIKELSNNELAGLIKEIQSQKKIGLFIETSNIYDLFRKFMNELSLPISSVQELTINIVMLEVAARFTNIIETESENIKVKNRALKETTKAAKLFAGIYKSNKFTIDEAYSAFAGVARKK